MPYKRYNYRARRRTYAKKRYVPKPVKSYVRTQVAKAERRESPLMFADINFTGDAVSTSPNAYSLVNVFVNQCGLPTIDAWPVTIQEGNAYRKVRVKIESFHYQIRYQNTTSDLYSTARFVAYSHSDPASSSVSSPVGIFDGTDIDSPPDTSKLLNMYFDKIRYVRDLQADEDSEAPGTTIIKGNVRVGRMFKIDAPNLLDWTAEDNDVRFEMQSNSSASPHPSVYGFIRIYGRVMY